MPRWMIPLVLSLTAIALLPSLWADFVNLDDGEYVTDNGILKNGSLVELLTTPVQGNHHPLTMLSLYLNFLVSGNDAWSYHLLNLLLHLANTYLLFRLAMHLSNNNIIVAFTTAILFGVHPMHVESVAWVSERKDVLYALFFLAGLTYYVKYVEAGSRKHYALVILFLALSLMSKPAAVIFPVVLLAIDFFKRRPLRVGLLVEKIPFFALAVVLGIITMLEQKSAGATGQEIFSTTTKVLFGFYGIMMYFVKMLLPVNLAVFYPYPAINTALPAEYYIGPLFFLVLVGLFYFTMKKYRAVAFGLLFYVINLLLVLQFLPVGSAVIAERYTYVPYIGLFFAAGWWISHLSNSGIMKASRIILPVAGIFAILSWNQSTVWNSSKSLWQQAVENHPSNKAYANMGTLMRNEKNYNEALEYFNKAIALNTIDHEAYNNRGNVYFDMNMPQLSIRDYRQSLILKPDYFPALDNMAAQYAVMGKFDSALFYENQALKIKPDYKVAYSNRALIYMQLNQYEAAIRDWQSFLEYEPDAADVYNTIGFCYQSMNRFQESLTYINKAIEMSPQPMFYLNRSYTYSGLQNMDQARRDALTARQGGVKVPDDHAAKLGIQ